MHVLSAVMVVVSACQPMSAAPDASVESELDAGLPDAGLPCGEGTHEGDGGCVSAIAWAALPAGPAARDHHATWLHVDAASTLVVFNGVDMAQGLPFWDVTFARLSSDGFLDRWEAGPRPLFWQAGMGVDGVTERLYSVSGMSADSSGTILTPRVQSLSFMGDGTPGAWREETPLPDGRFHVTATRVGEWLYAIGGRTIDGAARPEVFKARLGDDGKLGPWSTARSMPAPRTHHASFALGQRLYISGGFNAANFESEPQDYRDVLVATVDAATGELSEWASVALPFDISTHSAGVMEGYAYLVGGFDDVLNLSEHVRRAKLNDDGTFGTWEELTPLVRARAHVHHTPMHAGRIYSVGGNIGDHFTTNEAFVGFVY